MSRNVVRITADGIEPSTPEVSLDDVLSESWVETAWTSLVGEGGMTIGTWTGEPGRLRITDQPYQELSVIQSGRVAIEDVDGTREVFGPGDAFVLQPGFTGVWETIEPTEKIYAIKVPGQ